jgi:hypothetical protein
MVGQIYRCRRLRLDTLLRVLDQVANRDMKMNFIIMLQTDDTGDTMVDERPVGGMD